MGSEGKARPITPTQARIFAGMKPGRWMTAGLIGYEFLKPALYQRENAAKHANALHRAGHLLKKQKGEPLWCRPKMNP